MRKPNWLLALLLGTAACAGAPTADPRPGAPGAAQSEVAVDPSVLRATVWGREEAFAQTLADRDLEAFADFVSEDAVFFGLETQHGRDEVVAEWKVFFEGPVAPFAWRPDRVEVLGSGDLALSTGPILDPAGGVVGRFVSIWRLEGNQWRVVFDRGEDA